MKDRITKVLERFFISEPAIFSVLCTHELAENTRMACPVRCGRRRVEYNPDFIAQMTDNGLEEALMTEGIRILHGELTKVRPEDSYNEGDNYDDSRVTDVGFSTISFGDVDERGVQYRPHIVFFGEAVPRIKDAIAELSEADYMIIVGTSLLVQPAASLWQYTPVDCPVYVVDPEETPIDGEEGVIPIKEKATTGVATAIGKIRLSPVQAADYSRSME